jgi:hypothetical protein
VAGSGGCRGPPLFFGLVDPVEADGHQADAEDQDAQQTDDEEGDADPLLASAAVWLNPYPPKAGGAVGTNPPPVYGPCW